MFTLPYLENLTVSSTDPGLLSSPVTTQPSVEIKYRM